MKEAVDAIHQAVDHTHLVSCFEQAGNRKAAEVAGATRDEDPHCTSIATGSAEGAIVRHARDQTSMRSSMRRKKLASPEL